MRERVTPERRSAIFDPENLADRLEGSKLALRGWYDSQRGLDPEDASEHLIRDEHWDNWTGEFKKLVRDGYETSRYGVELGLEGGLVRGRELRELNGKLTLFDRVWVEAPIQIPLDYIDLHQVPQNASAERPLATNFSASHQFYTGNREMAIAFSLIQIGRMLKNGHGDLKLTL